MVTGNWVPLNFLAFSSKFFSLVFKSSPLPKSPSLNWSAKSFSRMSRSAEYKAGPVACSSWTSIHFLMILYARRLLKGVVNSLKASLSPIFSLTARTMHWSRLEKALLMSRRTLSVRARSSPWAWGALHSENKNCDSRCHWHLPPLNICFFAPSHGWRWRRM